MQMLPIPLTLPAVAVVAAIPLPILAAAIPPLPAAAVAVTLPQTPVAATEAATTTAAVTVLGMADAELTTTVTKMGSMLVSTLAAPPVPMLETSKLLHLILEILPPLALVAAIKG